MIPTPEQAWELLCEYNEGDFHRKHGRIVGDVLRWYANELGYGDEADFWQAVGVLHDLDFEQWPEQHCTKEQELLRERGIDERLIELIQVLTRVFIDLGADELGAVGDDVAQQDAAVLRMARG